MKIFKYFNEFFCNDSKIFINKKLNGIINPKTRDEVTNAEIVAKIRFLIFGFSIYFMKNRN